MDQTVLDTEVVEEEPSLRDTIEQQIEEHPEALPEHKAPVEAPPGTEKPAQVIDPTKPVEPQKLADQKDGKPATPQELTAPRSWRAGPKEKWNQIPRDIQEEIHRREGDAFRFMGSVGPKIRFADEVGQHVAPFVERLAANGASPQDLIGNMFSTVRNLLSNDAMTKAETIANIVQSYGVDLRALDQVLARRVQQPPEVYAARLEADRYRRQVDRYQSNEQVQHESRANQTLEAFAEDPKNEFFPEVRLIMADLLDAGQAKSLDDAYQAAIWANGDTRKILLQREAEVRAGRKTARAADARRASSSVNGVPRAPSLQVQQPAGGGQDMSLRDTIAAAFEAHESA